jgi:hypothetical protein
MFGLMVIVVVVMVMVWLFVEVRKRKEVRIGRVEEEVNGACKIDRPDTHINATP